MVQCIYYTIIADITINSPTFFFLNLENAYLHPEIISLLHFVRSISSLRENDIHLSLPIFFLRQNSRQWSQYIHVFEYLQIAFTCENSHAV